MTRDAACEAPPKFVKTGVGIFIVDQEHNIVLGRRISMIGNNELCLPGGKLEHGETARQGASRELLEETGLVVDPHQFTELGWTELAHIDERGDQYITLFHAVRIPGVRPHIENKEPNKCHGWQWFHLDAIPKCWRDLHVSIYARREALRKL